MWKSIIAYSIGIGTLAVCTALATVSVLTLMKTDPSKSKPREMSKIERQRLDAGYSLLAEEARKTLRAAVPQPVSLPGALASPPVQHSEVSPDLQKRPAITTAQRVENQPTRRKTKEVGDSWSKWRDDSVHRSSTPEPYAFLATY